MKIKITNPARKWPVECGRTYHARPAAPRENGQKVYFVHVAGDWFGISEEECEEVKEGGPNGERNDYCREEKEHAL